MCDGCLYILLSQFKMINDFSIVLLYILRQDIILTFEGGFVSKLLLYTTFYNKNFSELVIFCHIFHFRWL